MKHLTLALIFGTSLLAAGCGGGGAPIEGNVTNNGKAYIPSADGELSIALTADGSGKNFTGKVGEDGKFKIDAVPAGKYTVSTVRYPAMPNGERPKTPPMPTTLKLEESWEVGGATKSFTLEVTKLKKS